MNTSNLQTATAAGLRRPRRLGVLALLAALTLAAGCGGGGGDAADAGTPQASASSFAQGTITGLGSIIVNGVRYDDSVATVVDDSGASKTASALALGMRVEIDSSSVSAGTATARAVRFGSEIKGPVSAVDTVAGSLTVLGQTVDISSTTVFDDSLATGISGITVGTLVEVHGLLDANTGHYIATRVEKEDSATSFKLRGLVSALDTTAKTFAIAGANISYANLAASAVPGNLANGITLRVTLATAQSNGLWVATSLGIKSRPSDTSHAHVRGIITAYSNFSSFSVDGVAVDAASASFPDGSAGLGLGVQVSVEGSVVSGVLVATKVELESRHGNDDDRRPELHGAITALDTVAKTFVLRGYTVSYAGSVNYSRGTEANLAVGARIEVKGTQSSSSTIVQASKIKFES